MTFKDDIKQWFCSVMLYIQSFPLNIYNADSTPYGTGKTLPVHLRIEKISQDWCFSSTRYAYFMHVCSAAQFGSYTGVW